MFDDILQQAYNESTGVEFEEIPVGVEEFVTEIIGHPPLSEIQYDIIRYSTQIFRKETLIAIYGEQEGERRFKWTKTEVICALGKGSGKDLMARLSCLYVVYQLLCLKNPQAYYGKPDEYIDIMNIAINAFQANEVFFGPLVQTLKKAPWFEGKFSDTQRQVIFDKQIRLTSGHSESESLEGYNVILVVLDEISGFAEKSNTGNQKAKTSENIYKMHRRSVNSRYPRLGKLLLLSFPRYHEDFISTRYEKAIAEKETIMRKHTFKRDPELPDGYEGNEFEIEWEEDHIIRYFKGNIYCIKRPTWDVNPIVSVDDFMDDFDDDPGDAYTRLAAMPTANTEDAVFKNHERVDETFSAVNGVDNDGVFSVNFVPKPGVKYFMHVDLAQKHDRCVVALSHVEGWKKVSIGAGIYEEEHPVVVLDAIRWWQPTKTKSVDFKDVIDYILAVRRKGFDLKLVTFDRWNAHDTRNFLEENGIATDNLSVANDHYSDFKVIMYDRRLVGPQIPELHRELKELMWIKGKVDHPRSGYKDLSDAACGATYNAVAHTPKDKKKVIEARTYTDVRKNVSRVEQEKRNQALQNNIIHAPKKEMPLELRQHLSMAR